MQNPNAEIRRVVRELAEPDDSQQMLAAVEKYFAPDAQIFYPVFNSPKAAGIEGVKSAYKMLRVLTYGNNIDFHMVAFDLITVDKGVEKMKGAIDFTENLKVRLPLPDRFNPVRCIRFLSFSWTVLTPGFPSCQWLHFRFITRIDLVKNPNDDRWYVQKQEDSLPQNLSAEGLHLLPFDVQIVNAIKFMTGAGTLLVGGTLARLGL
ncbi:hypothetical protein JCM8097_005137 [Rhodosporidiobolus ruineniae]